MSNSAYTATSTEYVDPPMVSGRLPLVSHALAFLLDPDYHQLFFKETDGVFSMRQGCETLLKMFDKKLFVFAHATEAKEQMRVILPLLKNNDRFVPLMSKNFKVRFHKRNLERA